MSKNRYINTHFWDDTYILDRDPTEKLIFLYALTNPLTSISGCYEISLKRIAFDTGIDQEMVIKILSRFKEDGKMMYMNGWLCITNFIKHQKLNPNIEKGINVELEKVPGYVLKAFESLSEPSNYININLNSNLNNNTPEKKKIYNPETCKFYKITNEFYTDLINIVNPTRLKNNKPNLKRWSDSIRLLHDKDGVSYDEMKQVWTWAFNSSFWKSNVMSTDKLREKYDVLKTQMNSEPKEKTREQRIAENEEIKKRMKDDDRF